MSRISALIAELCPDGVESRPLGEVGEFIRGRRITKDDFVESGVGCIHYGEIYTRYGTTATETYSFVRPDLAARLRLARPGDLIIAATGENAEEVCKAVAWLGTEDIAIHDDCYLYRHSFDPTYVSYLFQSSLFHVQKVRYAGGAKVVRVSGENLARIRVPVPPLEIQREVVAILSSMESLEAALEAELAARRRQYAHYRNTLLTFTERDAVRWLMFGDVATIVRGGSPRPIQAYLTDDVDGINWIKIGDVAADGKYITTTAEKIRPEGASKSRHVEPGDFVLSNSMSFGRPYILQIAGCIHDGWLAIKHFSDTFNADFLYHLLRSEPVYRAMAQKASSSTVRNLNADIVKSLVLPAPDIDEQERIVDVLDKFDALVNDRAVGLPAELHARRRQSQHYLDQLVTFDHLLA